MALAGDPVDERADAGADRVDGRQPDLRRPRRGSASPLVSSSAAVLMAMPTAVMSGLVSRAASEVASMHSRRSAADGGVTPRMSCASARGREQARPAARRAGARASHRRRRGGTASPGPRRSASGPRRRAHPFDRAGDEVGDTASIATPRRRSARRSGRWRRIRLHAAPRISFSSASAVYFLPIEQSVPTVRSRLPLRFPFRSRRRSDGARRGAARRASCRRGDRRNVAEPVVQAARHVHAGVDRLDDRRDPVLRQNAAGVDGADDHRAAPAAAPGRRHVGEAGIGLAAGQAQLSDAPLAPPVDDAVGGLGGERVGTSPRKRR